MLNEGEPGNTQGVSSLEHKHRRRHHRNPSLPFLPLLQQYL